MIAHVSGTVAARDGDLLVIDVGGVGYEVTATLSALSRCDPGAAVTVPTYLHVREDAMQLFGFASEAERRIFRLLLNVNGVGPKLALAIVSAQDPERIESAVLLGDVAVLSSVSGVGKKTAERICLDLKDKIAGAGISVDGGAVPAAASDPHREARDALVALGYSVIDAEAALQEADGSTEDRVKAGLAALGGGRG
ncbi:MAG: Holliday junction branch migration protein RuvA [Gaiellales bacterium]